MTLWTKPWVPTQSVGMVPSWLLQTCLFRRLTCNNVGNKIVYYKDTVECQHLTILARRQRGVHGHAAELELHQTFESSCFPVCVEKCQELYASCFMEVTL